MYSFWIFFAPPLEAAFQEGALNANEVIALITSFAAAVNVFIMAYQAWKRNKPEIKKMEAEGESEIVDAAHTNLEGAKLSAAMLKERIDELRTALDEERKQRKSDRDYFTRRMREIDRELSDYRSWSARLAKQVIEGGKQPVPFISSRDASDPLILAITKEQEELAKAKTTRQAELGKQNSEEEAKNDSK